MNNQIKISEVVEIDENQIAEWKRILDCAPQYETYENGIDRDWLH
jgi:hypothetical protein